jgi:hypothetical protein
MIIREKIYAYLDDHPGRSAFEIATAIDEKIQSVASLLVKDIHLGRLTRKQDEDHHGPKGGYVYYLPAKDSHGKDHSA